MVHGAAKFLIDFERWNGPTDEIYEARECGCDPFDPDARTPCGWVLAFVEPLDQLWRTRTSNAASSSKELAAGYAGGLNIPKTAALLLVIRATQMRGWARASSCLHSQKL
jgi:hypothetical protein